MINTIVFISLFLFSFSISAIGSRDSLVSKTEEITNCFVETSSAYISGCMISLEKDKKKEYKKAYDDFVDRIKKMRDKLDYPDDFTDNISAGKKSFDNYIKHTCRAYSLLYEKDSYVYNTAYNRCMITYYDQKIKFYKDFIFT